MPLRILPQPDMFLRLLPKAAQAKTLQLLINRILPLAALEQFKPLHGKRFVFRTPGRELNLLMLIDSQGVHISRDGNAQADVTIRGDVAALMALCLGLEDSDTLFFSRRLLLTGDTSTGLLFKNVLANLDFDLRVELERQLGQRVASLLWRMAEQAIAAVEHLDHRLFDTRDALTQRFGLLSAEQGRAMEIEIGRMANTQAELLNRLDRRSRAVTR
ncbi:MAG: SCP2 sterol-binding domain-containing protein [Mariprofundaceae bacterium]